MSIFKGDSIYKIGGGGGGGYHDGGQIVDGEFMKVENNAVSSYDNTSRDPINFYFEPAEDEIINAVVELTTAVNSTVNVYVLRNGFYYLLGNVGGDTVTAGNDYKVNITGDSYAIEQVTGGGNDPEFVNINGVTYPLLKNNGILWTCKDLEGVFSGVDYRVNNGRYYYEPKDIIVDGWRLPKQNEILNLYQSYSVPDLKAVDGWPSGYSYPGTGASGFNLKANGEFQLNSSSVALDNWTNYTLYKFDDSNFPSMSIATGMNIYGSGNSTSGYYLTVRLVHDA